MSAFISELSYSHYPWRWALFFRYDAEMVEAIKTHIPSRDRKWCPELRQWWFKEEVYDAMLTLAERHCGSVRYVQADGDPAQALPLETVAAYRALHLLPGAPDDIVKAVYRALCKLHHPDTGGTTREMQRVNEAYGRITHR